MICNKCCGDGVVLADPEDVSCRAVIKCDRCQGTGRYIKGTPGKTCAQRRRLRSDIERLQADLKAKDRRVLELTEALQGFFSRELVVNASNQHIFDKAYRALHPDDAVPTAAPPSCGETVRPSSPESEETKDE